MLAVAALTTVIGATSASATATNLPGGDHETDIVVDTHGHVFISGRTSSDGIYVFNANGTLNTTIPHLYGGMALSDDSSTLYVETCTNAGDFDSVDTTTFADTGSTNALFGIGDCQFAVSGDRIWYSDGNGNGESTTTSTPQSPGDVPLPAGGNLFRAVPGHPTWMIDLQGGDTINLLDVSDPTNVTVIASKSLPSTVHDVVVATDGSKVVLASDTKAYSLTLPSFGAGVTYLTGQIDSVAISPPGGKVVATRSDLKDSYVTEYNSATGALLQSWAFPIKTPLELARGAAFSANGDFIYDVTDSSTSPTGYTLHTVQVTPLTTTQFGFKASRASVTSGGAVTLTAHLGVSTTAKTVTISKKAAGATKATVLVTHTVGTSGNLAFVDHPKIGATYTATWSGDTTHLAVSRSAAVKVVPVMHLATKGGYATSAGVRLYHYAKSCTTPAHTACPTFQFWTAPLRPATTVTFLIERRSPAGVWAVFKQGSAVTGTGGKATVSPYYKNTATVGVPQRVRFTVATSAALVGKTSGWLNFRVTS